MGGQTMESAERAAGLLEAWERHDLPGLEAELDRTERACRESYLSSYEEQERLELLDGIVGRVRREMPSLIETDDSHVGRAACLRLLAHLAGSGRPAIRFEKLSFCLY
ncbi:MAG TPA: hypothetical protein VJN43_11690 [Bryobacteraceae bacterium]|nr:hypothetical protein [Bryobacteraceae bacterium]